MYNVNTGMVPSYIQNLVTFLITPLDAIEIYLYLLIELVFHINLVFHQPLSYGIVLTITLKLYQHCPLLKRI